jgi:hypothetical protein
MAGPQPRYSKEEFARRGDEIYESEICPHVEADNKGKFVAIDIETEPMRSMQTNLQLQIASWPVVRTPRCG